MFSWPRPLRWGWNEILNNGLGSIFALALDMSLDNTSKPPISNRRKINREKIYSAAMRLFALRGFHETTMQEIAIEAGVARASVFNHFPEKAALLGKFFEQFSHDVIKAARSARVTGCQARLEAMFAAIGPIASSNKAVFKNFSFLASGGGPLADVEQQADDEMLAFFLDLLEDGQAQGEIAKQADTRFTAQMMLGLLTITAHDWINSGQTSSLQADLSARFELLFQGIGKKV